MRTTLNLDDDVLMAVKERARREGRSAGEVLSELARQALTGSVPPRSDEPESFAGFRPFRRTGGQPVTNDIVNQLRDEEGV
jgi:hypothetical protein